MPAAASVDDISWSRSCGDFWAACCTERVLSPVIVLSIHTTIVCIVAVHREPLLLAQGSWERCEWLLVATTLGFYLRTSLTDPGWLRPSNSGPAERQPSCCALLLGCCCCCCCCRRCRRRAAAGSPGGQASLPAGTELESAAGQQSGDPEQGIALAVAQASETQPGAGDAGRVQKRRGGAGGAEDIGTGAEEAVPLQSGQELRWCTRCHLYQPLRTKHCRDCGRCVRTHDHHCPWVGTCVGENNRVLFLWFLYCQCFELAAFFHEGVHGISILEPSIVLVVCLLVIAMFFLMVFCLLLFHTFLMLSGLTTWEQSSRTRISYMKNIPAERISPFTRTIMYNATTYCCGARWCPAPLRRLAPLRYDEEGGILWELLESYTPCCLLRHCTEGC